MEQLDFERILIQFRRSSSLPSIPKTTMALVRAIDSGEASAVDLERIIASDPALATAVLRVSASSSMERPLEQVATLRHAIMAIGQRTIRNLGISLSIRHLSEASDVPSFSSERFARHSLATGFLARYIFARKAQREPFGSQWCADEIFAAGVLHDLGVALLVQVCPEAFARTQNFATRFGVTLEAAFMKVYKGETGVLGAAAAETWALPSLFPQTMKAMNSPWTMPEEFTALACLSYANHLACLFGESIEVWPCQRELSPEVEMEVGLEATEVEVLREVIERHMAAYFELQEPEAA